MKTVKINNESRTKPIEFDTCISGCFSKYLYLNWWENSQETPLRYNFFIYHRKKTAIAKLIYKRITKNIFNKNEKRCRDVKTQKPCKQDWEANIGPKITSSTYVGLYGSDFGSYVSFPVLFAWFLGFDIPTSFFIFIENVFCYSCFHRFFFWIVWIFFCRLTIYHYEIIQL